MLRRFKTSVLIFVVDGMYVVELYTFSKAKPFKHLFSFSLNNGVVPTEWKLHAITPVFKLGDKSNVKNYRPISLLCNISKALERLVYNKVLDYYSSSISHYSYQFGFCKNKSTLQQLLLYFNDLCSSKKQTDCIYLDFPKLLTVSLIMNSL